MPERSLALPLNSSGKFEVADAIIEDIRRTLYAQGSLAPNNSYVGFKATIALELYSRANATPPLNIEAKSGDTSGEPEKIIDIEIPVKPPNQVREEADLPLPVQAGSEVKWVKKPKQVKKNSAKAAEPETSEEEFF